MKKIINEIILLLQFIVMYAPNEKIGQTLRKIFWSWRLNIGAAPLICRGADICVSPDDELTIGDNFVLGENVALHIGQSKGVYIGDNVGIARGSFVRSANHKFEDIEKPYMLQGHDSKSVQFNDREYSIVLDDNVWIGAHSVILSGTKLGRGCILAAGSVVSGEFPPFSIIVGNPARVVSNRKKRAEYKAD